MTVDDIANTLNQLEGGIHAVVLVAMDDNGIALIMEGNVGEIYSMVAKAAERNEDLWRMIRVTAAALNYGTHS